MNNEPYVYVLRLFFSQGFFLFGFIIRIPEPPPPQKKNQIHFPDDFLFLQTTDMLQLYRVVFC